MKITINGAVPTDVLPNLLDRGLAHLLGPEHTPPHLALGNVVLQFDLVEVANPKDAKIFDHARVDYEPSLVIDVHAVAPPRFAGDEAAAPASGEPAVELVDFLPKHRNPFAKGWPYRSAGSIDKTRTAQFTLSAYDALRLKTIAEAEEPQMTLQQLVEEGLDLALAKRGLKPLVRQRKVTFEARLKKPKEIEA